ncbi:DoxX family protein [Galbibacter sp. BG1]
MSTTFILISMFVSGILDIMLNKSILVNAKRLGFSTYFVRTIGVLKIIVCLGYFWPFRFSEKIKKLIYFGFFIELFIGLLCHICNGDTLLISIFPVLFIIPLLISYYTFLYKLSDSCDFEHKNNIASTKIKKSL